jgi:disulfide bond formation protein DsbB
MMKLFDMIRTSTLVLLAGAGSAGMLISALGFQFIAELIPCPLCIWQRWPHVGATVIAVLCLTVLWRYLRPLAVLAMATLVTGAGISLYHTGIERNWWEGPDSCTSGDISGMSTEDLLAQIMEAPLIRCDEVVWEMFGLSMASWNGVISLGLAGLWLLAAMRKP